MLSGIYYIFNNSDGKLYVGSSNNLNQRKKSHFLLLRKNKHDNSYLQNSWNKYGEKNFEFIIIQLIDKDFLLECEQYWMDYFKSYRRNSGYNLSNKSGGGCSGIILTEQTKKRMSLNQQGVRNNFYGKKHTKESLQKISQCSSGKNNPFYGKHHTEKTKLHLSQCSTGNKNALGSKRSKEYCENMSIARTGKLVGKDNPMYGKHHTEEAKKKISLANKGSKRSDSEKQKMSDATKGQKNPFYGKTHSLETRKKMIQAWEIRKKKNKQ